MSKYIPKFNKEDRELLVLNNIFAVDDCVEYASRHNLNVLFTETTSSSSVEAMMAFKKNGYNIEIFEKENYSPDGLKLNPLIYVLFTCKKDALEEKILTDEEIECFNSYIEDSKMDIAFGNSDWCDIYHKIVGDKVSDYAKDKMNMYQ